MDACRSKLLFVVTVQPKKFELDWSLLQNYCIKQAMVERGVDVSMINWLDESLTTEKIAKFDTVTFLWCDKYDQHPRKFEGFLRERLAAALLQSAHLAIINDIAVILWNYNKAVYLQQLESAGFKVPRTAYINDISSFASVDLLAAEVGRLGKLVSEPGLNPSVVVKPSISASSKQTYLIRDPFCLSDADVECLSEIYDTGTDGSLMIQSYEPEIKKGELSLIYIAPSLRFAVKKVPIDGEFRCQSEFGGSTTMVPINAIPDTVKDIAESVLSYINDNVGQLTYCRVDGVLRDSGDFVIMEIEAIEPELFLEMSDNTEEKEALCDALMKPRE